MNAELDALIDRLVAANVARPAAEAQARRMLGLPAGGVVVASEDDLREELEDVHVVEGRRLMQGLGFEIVSFSQKKRAKVTPGIPDTKFYHRRRRLTLWWEAKAEWGRQSPAQRNFQEMAEACGEIYVLGKLEALGNWLVANGVANRTGNTYEPAPLSSERPSSAA